MPGHETVGRVVKLAPDAQLGVREGDRVAVDEILGAGAPFRIYGYSDMTGEGAVGLWGGYGEYMEIFAGTKLHKMTDRFPAEQLTLFEPLANAVNWVDRVGVQRGRHRRRRRARAIRASRCSKRCSRRSRARVIVTGTSERRAASRHRQAARRDRHDRWSTSTIRSRSSVTSPAGMMADVVMDIASVRADRAAVHRPREVERSRCCSPGSSTSRRSPTSSPT